MSELDFLYSLQEVRTPFLNVVMNLVSQFAGEILLISALCILYWCIDKKLSYKLCFSFFVSAMAVQGLKIAFRIPRPWNLDPRLHVEEGAAPAASGYSFPSGHTQAATSLYGTLAFHFRKWWGFLAGFFIIGLIMFSRMYLGCHTPKDVLVSLCISLILVIVVNILYEKVNFTKKVRFIVMLLVEASAVIMIVFTALQIRNGNITGKDIDENAMDCFKTCGAAIGFGIGYFLETTTLDFDPKAAGKVWIHILKVIIGVVLSFGLKELPKIIFHTSDNPNTVLVVIVHIVRYAMIAFFALYLYPLLFTKVLSRRKKEA